MINSQALTPLLLLAGASLFIPFWAAMRFGAAAARISAALWPAINLGALLLFDFSSMVLSRAVGEAAAAVVATVAYALMLVHLAALVVPRLRGNVFAAAVLVPGTLPTAACLLGLPLSATAWLTWRASADGSGREARAASVAFGLAPWQRAA